MSTVRLRRLSADYARLQDYVRQHPRVRLIQADGDPPEKYQFEYRVRSLRMVHGELQPVETHLVEVTLPLNYPRTPPQCRMLSPGFHPNIAPHAICVGDHWSAGESLQSIITRIGEMLAYQSYNVKSPLNGEAARWVEQHKDQMPLDRVSMLVEEAGRDEQTRRQKDKEMGAPPPAPPRVATARGVVGTKPGGWPVSWAARSAAKNARTCSKFPPPSRWRLSVLSAASHSTMNQSCADTTIPDATTLDADDARHIARLRDRHRTMLWLSLAIIAAAFSLQVRESGGVGLGLLPNISLPPLCGSRALFDVECPGCGLTRSFVAA